MKFIKSLILLISTSLAFSSCQKDAHSQSSEVGLYASEDFHSYWYSGLAEVNAYQLSQSRYGENREGKAMLIFVTEGFSKSKQVKLDNPDNAVQDKVTVMKLNYTKNFVTGIYPYSMMLSAFTPVSRNQFPNTLKITMSSQEWCGHVFSQMNLLKNKYEVQSYSYFEQEGDSQFNIEKVLLEDEFFTLIRIDPDHIPLGKVKILPGLFFTRLKHENLKPVDATISKAEISDKTTYTIQFTDRKMTIHVESQFPFKILGWEEEFMEQGKTMYTSATLDQTLRIDYWRKNGNEFTGLRDSLGLSKNNY